MTTSVRSLSVARKAAKHSWYCAAEYPSQIVTAGTEVRQAGCVLLNQHRGHHPHR